MEGVPRLYMIGLPAKHCINDEKPNFASVINHFIQHSYDRDPSLYSGDLDALHALRQSAMDAVMLSNGTVDVCVALKRYYAHLVRLTEKFPKLLQNVGEHHSNDDHEDEAAPTQLLTFTWKRALGGKSNKLWKAEKNLHPGNTDTVTVDYGNITYEMQCLLYNLGAAHSRLAAAQDRSPPLDSSSTSTTDGEESTSNLALKIACTHLQCAAWAFQQLLPGGGGTNNEHTKLLYRQKPPVTSRAVLEFSYNVTLAQAQECILEKSMMDGRKPLIIAKVSAMICEYFAGAVEAVGRIDHNSNYVSTNRLEKWRIYSEFKCRYYGAVTALFQGQHVQDQLQQMGTRVSFYRRAVNLLGRASQISESGGKKLTLMAKDDDSTDDDFYYYLNSIKECSNAQSVSAKELEMRRDTLSFAMDVAAAKWRAAKSENELIYHEPVVPVLSDDDDNDCLGHNLSSTTSAHSHQLERVKGASLVKPIGFTLDDPELLAVVINNNESSYTTMTLFKDLVPAATRQRAAIYRTEKRNMKANTVLLCEDADKQLSSFIDTLHLECLEMYKCDSAKQKDDGSEKTDMVELPQQLINCCAAYQALTQKQQLEKDGADEEDQLDVDMARLSAAVQAVDGMLDEIDRLLKTEELGDSEYRRMVGRPYDYSAGRMRELRREASRYREAHVGRARDSWVTLSRAVRERRRQDLELLALPPVELGARLPPARPALSTIAAEVAASGAVNSSSYNASESLNQNYDSDETDEGNCGQLRQYQQESLMRLDRLNLVVGMMKEVREQRQMLLTRLREEMDKEDKNAKAVGQDDTDVLGSEDNVMEAVTKKLDERYGNLVNLIEQNLAAQLNILDAVRTAYARAAPERRAYANAMQRRRTLIASLLDAYESFAAANGGPSMKTGNELVAASLTSGLLPDDVLAERCTKGLDFYQRMLTNVSKLLQRVKGTCLVQTEQRDQIIKQHCQSEEATQPLDDDSALTGGLDNLLANFSATNDQDHQQDDLAALIESFGNSGLSNKPLTPMVHGHWNQEHNVRRLSPLGSEQKQLQQQQQYHQYQSQTQPMTSLNFIPGIDHYYLDNHQSTTDTSFSNHNGVHVSSSQQQPPVVMTSQNTYPVVTTAYNISSLATTLNSSTTSLTSPLASSSSMPYSYYNYLHKDISSVDPILPSPSFNNIVIGTGGTSGAPTTSLINPLCLANKNGSIQNIIPSHSQRNSSNADGSGGFSNVTAALQRPLPAQYSISSSSSIDKIGNSVGYGSTNEFSNQLSTTMLLSQHQQFYPQQYQQQTSGNVIGLGTAGLLLQQHQLIAGNDGTGVSADVQSSLPLTSPSISTSVNSCGASTIQQSPSITNVDSTSTASNFLHQQQQLYQQHPQLYQQQQPQMYLKQQQQQQHHPQLYKQEPQIYQQPQQPQIYQQPQQTQQPSHIYQQPQQIQQPSQIYQQLQQTQQPSQIYQQLKQQPHQLTTPGANTTNMLYYSSQQQNTSQLYQPQHQLQPSTVLASTVVPNQQQPSSLLNNSGNNYYQQLQQYNPPTTIAAVTPSLNTNTTPLNNYYYQQPSIGVPAFNQHQHQQQYYQQQHPSVSDGMAAVPSTSSPIVNLLDDDQQISGPPPIQPEKIIGLVNDCPIKTSTTTNNK